MTSAEELSADFILTLIHHRGGKIKYSELVNVFEAGLYHAAPDLRDRNRKHFKDVLTKIGFIIEEERTKYVILKPAWDGAFGVEENSLSAFVDDSKGFIDTDFPDKDPANVLEWWFLDPSTQVVTEGALLEDEKDDRSSCIPAIMITQADEKKRKTELKMCDTGEDLNCDIQSLRSETSSLLSEVTAAVSVKSDNDQEDIEDDLQSVTTSSVTSLFQRLQLDPLEHDWIRFAAMGNTAALTDLLLQDPALASKKGTALHWAAKHGKEEMAETIARAGIDVNVKSHGGYTPLHIAALHGHRHIIQLLINTYNAKANIRDYYGKMPMHYWKGNEGLFEPAFSQSCSKVAGEDQGAQKCVRFRSGQSCSQTRTQMESLSCPDMTVQDKKQALMGKGCSLSCASN